MARAPRGAMTKIESNVHIVVVIMLLRVRRPSNDQNLWMSLGGAA